MVIFNNVLIIIISMLAITKGAEWLVISAAKIARRLGISELVIGLTIVAFGTSAPEFGVSILAALDGKGDISAGNIVGSNIFNLGFILGTTAIVHILKTNITIIKRDGLFLLFGSILLTVISWDLIINRIEGLLLFSLLILYLIHLYAKKECIETDDDPGEFQWWDLIMFFVGTVLVLSGANFLVTSSVKLARIFGISEWVIGATIVAAGTSAPEFAISLVAVLRGKYGISIGNLIGSDIFNMYGALGLAAILKGLSVDIGIRSNLIILSSMVIILLIFMRTGWQISKKEGFALLAMGITRWIFLFFEKSNS